MFKNHVFRPAKFLIAMVMVMALMITGVCNIAFATDAEIISKQIGGSYNSITNSYGGERHHMPSNNGYSQTTVYRYTSTGAVDGTVTSGTGPCILMTVSDHQKTASWGSSTAAVNFRAAELTKLQAGQYGAAQTMGINDVQAKFGSRYNTAISRMVSYTNNTLNWNKK